MTIADICGIKVNENNVSFHRKNYPLSPFTSKSQLERAGFF